MQAPPPRPPNRSEAALPQAVLDGYSRCTLAEERDRAFVRRVLFASDHDLFRALCASGTPPASTDPVDGRVRDW